MSFTGVKDKAFKKVKEREDIVSITGVKENAFICHDTSDKHMGIHLRGSLRQNT